MYCDDNTTIDVLVKDLLRQLQCTIANIITCIIGRWGDTWAVYHPSLGLYSAVRYGYPRDSDQIGPINGTVQCLDDGYLGWRNVWKTPTTFVINYLCIISPVNCSTPGMPLERCPEEGDCSLCRNENNNNNNLCSSVSFQVLNVRLCYYTVYMHVYSCVPDSHVWIL